MLFENKVFIGIDPTAGEKPMIYVALDQERSLLALGNGGLDDVLAFTGGQHDAVVAICAPRNPNARLMSRSEIREKLSPPPAPGRWENFRLVDYIFRQHHIFTLPIPAKDELCPKWMRQGFLLFRRLVETGYKIYPDESSNRVCFEVYPHATFCALLGVLPFPKSTLEGRLQRQLVLYERGLRIPDPMELFEEITRHKLLNGVLPLENIFSSAELDALGAAYTAWLVHNEPKNVLAVGDIREGQIIIPVSELKPTYQ